MVADPVPKCHLSIPPEVIVFIASLLDRAFLLIYQPFIFDAECMRRVEADPSYVEITNRSADYICHVAVKGGNGNQYGPEIRRLERDVSAETSRWVFYVALCRFVPGFFADSMLGPLGDHFSRKLALLLPTTGLLLMCWIVFIVANYFYQYYYLVLVGVLVYGITGQYHAIVAATLAYAAHHSAIDATEKKPLLTDQEKKEKELKSPSDKPELTTEQRMSLISSTRISILQALINLGIGVGLLSGGVFVWLFGPARAFGYLAILATIAFFIVLFGIKDLPASEEHSYADEEKKYGKLWLLRMPMVFMADAYYATFCKPRPAMERTILGLVVFALLGFVFCYELHPFVDWLYLSLSPRSFTPMLYGIFSLVKYTLVAIVLLTLLPATYYYFREKHYFPLNTMIAVFGMVMLACAYLMMAMATNKLMVFLTLPFDAWSGLPYSAMRIILANLVPTHDCGKVYAVFSSLDNLLILSSVFFYNQLLWPLALSPAVNYPGLPYVVGACLLSVPITLLLITNCLFLSQKNMKLSSATSSP